jgi:hypothetical protein
MLYIQEIVFVLIRNQETSIIWHEIEPTFVNFLMGPTCTYKLFQKKKEKQL